LIHSQNRSVHNHRGDKMKRIAAGFLVMILGLLLIFDMAGGSGLVSPLYLPLVNRASPIIAWTSSPAAKIQPTTHWVNEHELNFEGALGATESYQVVISADISLSGVNLGASNLSDQQGHTIPASSFTFYREAFIDYTGVVETEPGNQPVPKNSPTGDTRLPDPLIPFVDPYTPGWAVGAPFAVAAGLNQPVWVDLAIPLDAVAGTYSGTITVSAANQPSVVLPVTLIVWNLILPDMNVVTTYFGMGVNHLIDYHSGITSCSGSSCWMDWNTRSRTIVKRYEELLHQHRAGTQQNFVVNPQGGACTPPTSWTEYDAAMQPYMDGTYWSDKVPSGWIQTPFSPGVSWGLEANCSQTQYTAVAKAWASHLKAKGWFNKALAYAYDEPPASAYAAIARNSAWMQAGDAGWKAHIMDTTMPTPENVGTLNPALGIYAVPLSAYDQWDYDSSVPASQKAYGRANWPSLFGQGIQLWFYESNAQSAPYPTFAANTLLGYEPRIMLWGAWYEQASGFCFGIQPPGRLTAHGGKMQPLANRAMAC
jgi:hypothetical protein